MTAEQTCLIGIAGFATAGKDTLADLLVERYGFTKVAFADALRSMAAACNPVVGYHEDVEGDPFPVRYNDALEWHGYRDAKELYPEVREFLQRLGTEAGRNILGENVWVDAAMRNIKGLTRVVFSDMRFPNEAEAIRSRGGHTLRMQRPGVTAANDHISEHALDGWNYTYRINNVGTIADLCTPVDNFFARHAPWIVRRV